MLEVHATTLEERMNTSPSVLTFAYLFVTFLLFFMSVEINSVFKLPAIEALPLTLLGIVLLLAGLVVRMMALRRLLSGNHGVEWNHVPEVLIQDGVFRYSRNPAYLGFFLMLAGVLLAEVDLPMLVTFAVLFTLVNRQVFREERLLAGKFGDAYSSYRRNTRRWL